MFELTAGVRSLLPVSSLAGWGHCCGCAHCRGEETAAGELTAGMRSLLRVCSLPGWGHWCGCDHCCGCAHGRSEMTAAGELTTAGVLTAAGGVTAAGELTIADELWQALESWPQEAHPAAAIATPYKNHSTANTTNKTLTNASRTRSKP